MLCKKCKEREATAYYKKQRVCNICFNRLKNNRQWKNTWLDKLFSEAIIKS